jgi:hypothetical protein
MNLQRDLQQGPNRIPCYRHRSWDANPLPSDLFCRPADFTQAF